MVDQNISNQPPADHRIADTPGHAHPEDVGSIPVVGAHGVKYEDSDADTRAVFNVGLVIGALVIVSALGLIGFYRVLMILERAKVNDLPTAATDQLSAGRLPPQPRLEAIEDLRQPNDSNYQLLPRRAANFFVSQEELLNKGDDKHMPIAKAIEALAADPAGGRPGKLPAEKNAPPSSFSRRLPSKATSGRVDVGGQ
jgi:hypothetical protein